MSRMACKIRLKSPVTRPKGGIPPMAGKKSKKDKKDKKGKKGKKK